MSLLCRYHHREFQRRGWAVRMTNGIPEWLPPPWIDPDQQPRRNTTHHPPDFDFAFTGIPAPPGGGARRGTSTGTSTGAGTGTDAVA